jgi:aspartyl-tRNA synthetase
MPQSVKDIIKHTSKGAFVIAHENPDEFNKIAAQIRDQIGRKLDLIERNRWCFCWITDFPMYELNEKGGWDFSHNPFSMPQGGLEALKTKSPGDILAWQYDLVCNGYELSSGAVRNHHVETMYKAFEIAGYSKESVDKKFGAMINAFRYGAPPHAGIAPGIERMLMLLGGVKNLREIIPFPLSQAGKDLMMNAPSTLNKEQLDDLGIAITKKKS